MKSHQDMGNSTQLLFLLCKGRRWSQLEIRLSPSLGVTRQLMFNREPRKVNCDSCQVRWKLTGERDSVKGIRKSFASAPLLGTRPCPAVVAMLPGDS